MSGYRELSQRSMHREQWLSTIGICHGRLPAKTWMPHAGGTSRYWRGHAFLVEGPQSELWSLHDRAALFAVDLEEVQHLLVATPRQGCGFLCRVPERRAYLSLHHILQSISASCTVCNGGPEDLLLNIECGVWSSFSSPYWPDEGSSSSWVCSRRLSV